MSNTSIFISQDEPAWSQALPDVEVIADSVISEVFKHINTSEKLDFLEDNKPVIFNLSLSNNHLVQELNRDYRGMDKPTNVLSFANIDDPDFYNDIALYEEVELGDIIIALETLQQEADIKHISLKNHFCHLLTHGLLHLLGFDHIEDDEAEHMEATEIKILANLNIPNPYQEL